jgi:hypothetical protein
VAGTFGGSPHLSILTVTGTNTNATPFAGCGGDSLVSHAAPCAGAATHVQPGEYCGPVVGGGAVVQCWWFPLTGVQDQIDLAVGFDTSGDGNVFGTEGPAALSGLPPGVLFTVTNPHAVSARVVAYPVSALAGGSASDSAMVSCQ